MSYLRTGIPEVRWLLLCAPLLGAVVLNACLSETTTPGDDTMTGGDPTTGTGVTGSGGADMTTTGTAGSGSPATGAGGSSATGAGGAGMVGAGGASMGAGGSGQPMTGDMTGNVKGGVRWVGRFDATNEKAIKFNWGGAGFIANISLAAAGNVTVQMSNENPTYFQPVIDGKADAKARVRATQGASDVPLAMNLAAGMHKVEFYRETEAANNGVSTFIGITGGTLMPPPKYSGRLIETIGDSLTNGYGELGSETHPNSCSTTVNGCGYTIDTQSNYWSYAALLGQQLNADWSIICNSGWGLYRDNTNGLQNVMPNVWDDAYFNYSNPPKWNYSVKAQVVIINLGTNDLAKGDPGVGYKDSLKALIGQIRAKYGPDTWIFPTTGSMIDGTGIAKLGGYIKTGIMELAPPDPKVEYVDLGTQDACGTAGTGCQWHPSVAEHARLAAKLKTVIQMRLGWQ